jgi:hypothetical protein
MKDKLRGKDIGSLPKLINEIKVLWITGLSREYLKTLSDSMPRRIHSVLKAKGEATKY